MFCLSSTRKTNLSYMSAAMENEIILLDLRVSSFAARVRIALEEKGLKYESLEEDLSNKSSLLLKMNPVHKQVPVLIHNGVAICESMLIVQYIDEMWSHTSPLLPSDPYQRAYARFWADYAEKKIYQLGRTLITTIEDGVKEAARRDMIECLKTLTQELGEKPYFGGERFGYTDLGIVPYYTFFYTYETLGKFKVEEECPKLAEWAKRCLQRDSVAKSLADPQEVYAYIAKFRKKLGFDD